MQTCPDSQIESGVVVAEPSGKRRAAWVVGAATGVTALLGFIANVDGTLSFGERLIGGSESAPTGPKPSAETSYPGFAVTTTSTALSTQPPPSAQDQPPAKTITTAAAPAPARPRGPLLISFSIASGLEKERTRLPPAPDQLKRGASSSKTRSRTIQAKCRTARSGGSSTSPAPRLRPKRHRWRATPPPAFGSDARRPCRQENTVSTRTSNWPTAPPAPAPTVSR